MRPALLLGMLLLAALPVAGAQEGGQAESCRAPLFELQSAPPSFQPGATYNLQFAIENTNGPPVDTTRATITTATPAGWSATPAQRELTLRADSVSMDVLSVTAPHRGNGEPRGNITVLVTFVCTSGDVQTSASTTTVFPVEVEAFQAPWPLVLAGFLVLAVGVAVLGIRRLRRGVAISCRTPERLVAPGKSAKFELVIENRRGKPQRLHLLALGAPPEWQVHLALDEIDLEPGEEKNIWAILKAPPTAEPGDETVLTLRLISRGGAREGASTTVKARVTGA